ncbi:hypothetical protein BaRGS_00007840 [Batillaria attramentaria]|uniref:Uncharacterized protein n=1 Tax=Batillaria attramentaria TaxID=370345 RepID=A0ABD0LN62_9CAEN
MLLKIVLTNMGLITITSSAGRPAPFWFISLAPETNEYMYMQNIIQMLQQCRHSNPTTQAAQVTTVALCGCCTTQRLSSLPSTLHQDIALDGACSLPLDFFAQLQASRVQVYML